MYSGHLLLMTSLYGMLFDDDEFEQEGSIVFDWNPIFWGLGHEKYVYSNRSLATVIRDQMERNDYVGVCCEPNAVFVVCNQFPVCMCRWRLHIDSAHRALDHRDALQRRQRRH